MLGGKNQQQPKTPARGFYVFISHCSIPVLGSKHIIAKVLCVLETSRGLVFFGKNFQSGLFKWYIAKCVWWSLLFLPSMVKHTS